MVLVDSITTVNKGGPWGVTCKKCHLRPYSQLRKGGGVMEDFPPAYIYTTILSGLFGHSSPVNIAHKGLKGVEMHTYMFNQLNSVLVEKWQEQTPKTHLRNKERCLFFLCLKKHDTKRFSSFFDCLHTF